MVAGIWIQKAEGLRLLRGVACLEPSPLAGSPTAACSSKATERVSQQDCHPVLGGRSDILTDATFRWSEARHWSHPHWR